MKPDSGVLWRPECHRNDFDGHPDKGEGQSLRALSWAILRRRAWISFSRCCRRFRSSSLSRATFTRLFRYSLLADSPPSLISVRMRLNSFSNDWSSPISNPYWRSCSFVLISLSALATACHGAKRLLLLPIGFSGTRYRQPCRNHRAHTGCSLFGRSSCSYRHNLLFIFFANPLHPPLKEYGDRRGSQQCLCLSLRLLNHR